MATQKIIHIDEIDPGLRERAFGDGLTAEERFRADIGKYVPDEQIERMLRQLRDQTEREVAAGSLVQIIGPRGVIGWLPVDGEKFDGRTDAQREADAKRARKRARAASGRK